MNTISKNFVIIGISVQVITAVIYAILWETHTFMSFLSLFFILFAELEFFGGIAAFARYIQDQIPNILRIGLGLGTGVYCAICITISLAFMGMDIQYLRPFILIQLLVLAVMVFLDAVLFFIWKFTEKRS